MGRLQLCSSNVMVRFFSLFSSLSKSQHVQILSSVVLIRSLNPGIPLSHLSEILNKQRGVFNLIPHNNLVPSGMEYLSPDCLSKLLESSKEQYTEIQNKVATNINVSLTIIVSLVLLLSCTSLVLLLSCM